MPTNPTYQSLTRQQAARQQAPQQKASFEFSDENLEDASSAMQAPSTLATLGARAVADDLTSSGRPATPTKAPAARSPLEGLEEAFPEVEGQAVQTMPSVETGTEETGAEVHQEVGVDGAESGEEFVVATPEQMAAASGAEAGEESAASDLPNVPGFGAREGGEEGIVLREAGSATEAGEQEFLPILAALVPTLVSTVGPMVAKAISSKISPRTRATLTRIANAPRPPVAPRSPVGGAPQPQGVGSLASLLPLLAKLLQAKTGEAAAFESEVEGAEAIDESFVTEAAAAMEVIIGVDNRVPITNTTEIPWRRYCALRITFPSGSTYRGTGFFIGPRAVATAGHCVYLRNQGGWARKIEVIPGCNGSKRPFGQAESTLFRSVNGWVSSQLPECDYGCIFLPTGAFAGRDLGHFGAGAFDAQTLVAQPAVVAGYHGDKPFAELWGMKDVIKTVAAKTIAYNHDTVGGCSGAPVYIKRNGVRYVVGIHNYGASVGNSATRITPPVYQRLLAWSKM